MSGRNVKWPSHFGKTVWQFIESVNKKLPYDPSTDFPGIYNREMKTYVHIKPCTGTLHCSVIRNSQT